MIEKYGWDIAVSVYLVYGLGLGLAFFLLLKLWEKAFEKLMKRFKVDREFIDFLKHKYRKKKVKPKLRSENREE